MKKYKLIIPPLSFEFEKMSKKELQEHTKWFLDIIPQRIEILKEYINNTSEYQKWNADFTVDSLNILGKWFSEHVTMRQRTKQEKDQIYEDSPNWFKEVDIGNDDLSLESFSIAIDIGMYLSQVFLKNNPSLCWKTILTGSKKNINYGQPCLSDFGSDEFNPVHMMVVLAYGLSDGTKSKDTLAKIYDIWIGFIVDK